MTGSSLIDQGLENRGETAQDNIHESVLYPVFPPVQSNEMKIMMNENNKTLHSPSSQDHQTLPNIVSDDNDSLALARTDIA